MSFLSNIRRLYRNLLDALHWAHMGCKAATRINAEIQQSNAPVELKDQAAAFLASATALCAAIEAFKNELNNPA